MTTTQKRLLTYFLLLAVAGASGLAYKAIRSANQPSAFATVWPSPKALPNFNFTDQDGNRFGKENLQGKWSMLFFGFTHCPDICPATLQQLALANQQIAEAGYPVPDIVLVSVDPERDTPEVMAEYVGHFPGEIHGVTGTLDELQRLTSSAGVFFQKSPLPDGSYTVDHTAAVMVIDEDGAIHASFGAPHSIEYFVHDMPILMRTR